MKLARYMGGGRVAITDEPISSCPPGGLLVQTEACGLCSGELMDWYMDRKIPHVFGHEVSGIVVESQSENFPVGCRVSPHHHAPCLNCDFCQRGLFVHCPTWKSTKLNPGGMAEYFTVSAELLNDCHRVDDIAPRDAALVEPLACVMKSVRRSRATASDRVAVVGLGALGVLHQLVLPGSHGFDLSQERIDWAAGLGLQASATQNVAPESFDVVIVCPGSNAALDFALKLAAPGARIVLFAPLPPGEPTKLDLNALYFRDIELIQSYSCGPSDTEAALKVLRNGTVCAEKIVSEFVSIDDLPRSYVEMKAGRILKSMVIF